jgi:hypothetical protein|tara:strand:+ start:207 stop:596 length:390 start_codon:yes stop_codon:yes gene_type:complete
MRLLIVAVCMWIIVAVGDSKANPLEKWYKEPLTEKDKVGIVLFNVLQTIDMLQTLEIANNDNYYEKNKILGKHPSEAQVITYFIARGFAHYEATKMIPEKYRKFWHTYNVVYNYDVIRDNHNIGIRIDF